MENHTNLTLPQFKKLARNWAKKYEAKNAVIGLTGQLGSGKTAFVKEFAKSLGIKQAKSPSFIVIASYLTSTNKNLLHWDLYRLKKSSELVPLGINEMLSMPNRIILIEWADKFPKLRNQCNIIIQISISSPKTRNVKITKI